MPKRFVQTVWLVLNTGFPSGVWNVAACWVGDAHSTGPGQNLRAPSLSAGSLSPVPELRGGGLSALCDSSERGHWEPCLVLLDFSAGASANFASSSPCNKSKP